MKKERGVFQRPPNSGVWWVCYADGYGKIHREKAGPRSLARALYQKRKTEVREGRFFPPRRRREILFGDFIKLYLKDYARANKRSWRDDRSRSKRLIEHFKGSSLGEISPQMIEQFKAKLIPELSPASVNRHLALVKTIFTKAIEWGKIEKSPAAKIKLLQESNQRTRFLTESEEEKLKAVMATDPESWALVEFAFHTGLRRAEMFTLVWTNVNLKNKVITIPRAKSGKARYVSLNSRVMEILRDLPSRMRGRWVFVSSNGSTPMIGSNFVKRVFRPALNKAGIEGFRWHDLRHTFASRLVMRGTDLRSVMELMGHKDIKHTMRYSHLSNSHLDRAVEVLVRPPNKGMTDAPTGTKQVRDSYSATDKGLRG